MLNRDLIKKLDTRQPWFWLATWCGCGLMLPGPGTWGTLGGLPFAVLALVLGGWPALLAFLIAVCIVGWWAAAKYEAALGTHDAPSIVIDEVAGIALTLLLFPSPTPLAALSAFLLFRFYDILKPWPVRWADQKIGGASGVMIDDLIAAVMAGATMWAGALIWLHFHWKAFA